MTINSIIKDSNNNPLPNTLVTYNSADNAVANISYKSDSAGHFLLDPALFSGNTHWTPDHIIVSGVISND